MKSRSNGPRLTTSGGRGQTMMWTLTGILLAAIAAATPARAEPRLEILDQAMVDQVQQAYVRYPSGELMVTGWIFVNPFGKRDVEPCLVFNHGGVNGVNEATRAKCRWLAKQGYIVFAPSYRGEDDSEGHVEIAEGEVDDVVNAILELRSHPGIEPGKFVLLGLSHGALISVKAAARPELADLVQATVAAYGVMDIYDWYQYLVDNDFDVSDSLSVRVYGSGPTDKPKAFAARNAVDLVDRLSDAPLMLVQGELDDIVPVQQARLMIDALRASGRLQDRIRVYSQGAHGFLYWDDPKLHTQIELRQAKDAWQDILSFFAEFVGGDDRQG